MGLNMALWIQVTPISPEPIYQQIVGQVARAIAAGEVSPGDKLPTVRSLAEELVINPNTVAHAYGLLEQEGLVTTKTGSGTFVAAPHLRDADAAELAALAERMDGLIARALNMGLTARQTADLLAARLRNFRAAKKGERKK
jgi:GntR family transcriptional regulator